MTSTLKFAAKLASPAVAELRLVRSMRHLALPLVAAFLTSCATPVVGPYAASISADDIQQIHQLVAARSDMPKVILSIHATQEQCVYVETTRPISTVVDVSFTACKRRGKWHINERSVKKWRTIVIPLGGHQQI